MMARASPGLIPRTSSSIGSCMCTFARRRSRHVRSGWSADFRRSILPWEAACMLEGLAARATLSYGSVDLIVSRGALRDITPVVRYGLYLSPILRIKLKKGGFDGAQSPITFPMTIGLGGSMSVVLNALPSVPATGGGGTLLHQGYPLLTPSTLAPEPLFEHLCSSRGF